MTIQEATVPQQKTEPLPSQQTNSVTADRNSISETLPINNISVATATGVPVPMAGESVAVTS